MIAGLFAATATAGCSGSDDKSSSATLPPDRLPATAAPAETAVEAATDEMTAETTAATTAAATADTAAPVANGSVAVPPAADPGSAEGGVGDVALAGVNPFGSALAITAAVDVRVDDVRIAVNELPDLVVRNGGAIFDSQIAVGDPSDAAASVTVKVPPVGLEPMIADLGGLGEVTGRSQQTEDVADQLADTRNRIAAAQASVDRVRLLLASAEDIDAVIRIEGELTIRETALEQLLATERNVSDRVQLATLTITFRTKPPVAEAVVVPMIEGGSEVQPSSAAARALTAGWHAFVAVLRAIVVGAAYLAPVLVLLLIGSAVTLVVRRLRRGRGRRSLANAAVTSAGNEAL